MVVASLISGPALGLRHSAFIRHYRATPVVCLNRLLLEESECRIMKPENKLVADLGAADPRAVHVRKVLRAENGQTVRAGVLDKGRSDAATVRWVGVVTLEQGRVANSHRTGPCFGSGSSRAAEWLAFRVRGCTPVS